MSTITCSNFLPRAHLSAYNGDRDLLTAHGPFLELYDLDKFMKSDLNARDVEEPIRTRAFASNHVKYFTVFKDTDHVLAISSDFSKNKLSIKGSLIHRDLMLAGGYAQEHCVMEEPSRDGTYIVEAIPGTTEILVLSEFTLTHFKYSFSPSSDDFDVEVEVIAEFELQKLLPPLYTGRPIVPLAIDVSSVYALILSVGNSIVLVHKRREKWACRAMHDPQGSLLGSRRVMMLPGLEIAVLGGKYSTQFISTSYLQPGVSYDQLRVLQQRIENTTTKAMTSTTTNGTTYIYLVEEKNISLWKIEKNGNSHSINGPWTFVHSSENVELRKMGGGERQKKTVYSCKGDDHVISQRVKYEKVDTPQLDLYRSNPIAATVMRKNCEDATNSKCIELLAISYESGRVKILRTKDIIKNPMCEFIQMGMNKKQPVENLFPCWEFPLNPIAPLQRVTGLSNGVPIVYNLVDGLWVVSEIVQPRSALYTHVKSTLALSGSTVAVFYNRHDICVCLYTSEIKWRVDRLDYEIKECFLYSSFIAILTEAKILFLDIHGLLNDDTAVGWYNASVDYSTLELDGDTKQEVLAKGVASLFLASEIGDQSKIACVIRFKSGLMRSFNLCEKTPLSRDHSLNEIHEREFTGEIMAKKDDDKIRSSQIINNRNGMFHLTENGFAEYLCSSQDTPSVRNLSVDLFNYFPRSAQIHGLISIQGTEANDEEIYALAREKENGDFLYIKDVGTKDEMTMEPIPKNFGDNPIFGHFVGPKKDGRCMLYTTHTRRYGDAPELIRVDARLNLVHKTESLRSSSTLFQPDRVVKLVHRKSVPTGIFTSTKPTVNVVTYSGNFIEIYELTGKGRMVLKKEIELRNADDKPVFISSFDTYYVHSTNTLYIITAPAVGELTLVIWDATTNEHTCAESHNLLIEHNSAAPSAFEVFFLINEHPIAPPILFACFDNSYITTFKIEGNEPDYLGHFPIQLTNGPSSSKILATGNGILTDLTKQERHDFWIVSAEQVIVYCGRQGISYTKSLHHEFSSWEGQAKSMFLLSTRTEETWGPFANFVFVVKEKCRIGILATIHLVDSKPKRRFPQAIRFTEFGRIAKTRSIAIHAELLESTLLEYPSISGQAIEATIRLFVALKKSIKIYIVTMFIDSESLEVVEKVKLGEIPTSISDPTHLEVSRMEEVPDRVAPKYGIISGSEGTETVRICANKLQPPIDEDELSIDQE